MRKWIIKDNSFVVYFRPEIWTDVFAILPVICFGYHVCLLCQLYKLYTNFLIIIILGQKPGRTFLQSYQWYALAIRCVSLLQCSKF